MLLGKGAVMPNKLRPRIRKDFIHCQPYDLDGAVFGDCMPDGVVDDFWRFLDGDFDGVVDCHNPFDLILMTPDGVPDGFGDHPACDLFSEDQAQISGHVFLDSTTLGFLVLWGLDVVRGSVSQLSLGVDFVDLGEVVCLAEDQLTSLVFDTDIPPVGDPFFYVARLRDSGFYPYGFASCLERKVLPGNGDCVP